MNPKLIAKEQTSYSESWIFWIPNEERHYTYTIFRNPEQTVLVKDPSNIYKLPPETLWTWNAVLMDEKNPAKTFKQLKQLIMLQ